MIKELQKIIDKQIRVNSKNKLLKKKIKAKEESFTYKTIEKISY